MRDERLDATLNPLKIPTLELKFVTWHLWFMPVYLYIVPFIPFMFMIFDKLKGIYKVIPFIILGVLIFYIEDLDIHNYMKSIIYYSFWIYTFYIL